MRGAVKGLEKVGVLARLMPEAEGWVEVMVCVVGVSVLRLWLSCGLVCEGVVVDWLVL